MYPTLYPRLYIFCVGECCAAQAWGQNTTGDRILRDTGSNPPASRPDSALFFEPVSVTLLEVQSFSHAPLLCTPGLASLGSLTSSPVSLGALPSKASMQSNAFSCPCAMVDYRLLILQNS